MKITIKEYDDQIFPKFEKTDELKDTWKDTWKDTTYRNIYCKNK